MRHARAVMHVGVAQPSGIGENVPGFPVAYMRANRNFTYLIRGPWAYAWSKNDMYDMYASNRTSAEWVWLQHAQWCSYLFANTLLLTHLTWPFWCWDWNIPCELHGDQYHSCWCSGSLRRQVINNHGTDCVTSQSLRNTQTWLQPIYAPGNWTSTDCVWLQHPPVNVPEQSTPIWCL